MGSRRRSPLPSALWGDVQFGRCALLFRFAERSFVQLFALERGARPKWSDRSYDCVHLGKTPRGNYSILIVGKSGSDSHSATIMVTVN